MGFIDLHVHTTASDGTLSPTEVVTYAAQKELSVIAITDHDTVGGISEAINAAKQIKQAPVIVPGVEISCLLKTEEIHILGLMLQWEDENLNQTLASMREKRDSRNERMVERMRKDGIPITMEKLIFEDEDTVITRAHFARFLEQEGYVKTKNEAFEKYIGKNCPYFIPREYLTPQEAISLIHHAGGIAMLAHAFLYGFTQSQVGLMLGYLKPLGLDGLEAYHSSHTQGQIQMLRQYAADHNLLVSGGSDFHGSNKPDIELGSGRGSLRITDAVYRKIEQALMRRTV